MHFDKLHEECAVFGVSLKSSISENEEAAGITYNALLSMQHRGQEGVGIAVAQGNAIVCEKDVGLVSEVFTPDVMRNMPKSAVAIGHNRYSTTGSNSVCNVQPFVTEYLTGRIATAHNGNITNAMEIREKLTGYGLDFTATSDSEVISSLIAYRIIRAGDFMTGIIAAAKLLQGAFCLIIMGPGKRMAVVRDPNGYRPLCIGENETGVAIASESCALDSCGFQFVRDVKPGEVLLIEDGKILRSEIALTSKNESLCIFEYVYFARPDSILDNLSVYEARRNMGVMLAKENPVEADVVCGVPDSGLEAAIGFSEESGIPLATGFVKNRYIGRSFIFPTQAQRENAVVMKLNPLRAAVEGKRVVLVDDSIVRGTTSAKIVAAMKKAGAKEVHMMISSPPFRYTCYFGTDIDSEENLIANQITIEEIRQKIGADSLGYISIDGLKKACEGCSLDMCTGCFTGDYGSDVTRYSKNVLEKKKN
ncbi:amidophosphoribosyltransferase [Scatolibacter rhodanostii]|uniref:amidophosphoribosyltransferase n=1 Tax=Scatolibacter rhodanostii TaxID=2014781 RepID=UPI000C0835D4|nr:amidophosphoribosyltransferase [Scatolibacter rhodanostii]